MCISCGCGYFDGNWKYDMQPMVFDDKEIVAGQIIVQPSEGSKNGDDRYEENSN